MGRVIRDVWPKDVGSAGDGVVPVHTRGSASSCLPWVTLGQACATLSSSLDGHTVMMG